MILFRVPFGGQSFDQLVGDFHFGVFQFDVGRAEDGVWADAGFLSWAQIGRMAFRETPEIVLILLPRTGTASFRLPVPPGEYGAVRKALEEKVRARELNVEAGILGL